MITTDSLGNSLGLYDMLQHIYDRTIGLVVENLYGNQTKLYILHDNTNIDSTFLTIWK